MKRKTEEKVAGRMVQSDVLAGYGQVEGQVGGLRKGAYTKRGGWLGGFRQAVNTTR